MMIMTLSQLKERVFPNDVIEKFGDDYVVIQGDKIGDMEISALRNKDVAYLKGKQAYLKEAFDEDGLKPIESAIPAFDNILLFKREHLSDLAIEKLEEGEEDTNSDEHRRKKG